MMYIVFITMFDVYCYGIIYQQKIKQENYKSTFWQWLFWESTTSGKESDTAPVSVIRYRVIQKTIEVTGIIVILYYCGLWAALGLLVSHYLLTYDLLFYIVMAQTYLFADFEKNVNTYWLQNWYQSGYFIFKPFNSMYFWISGLSGLVIAAGACYISLRKRSITNIGSYFNGTTKMQKMF